MEIEGAKKTLYVNNLNEKVRTDEMRQSLFLIFSKFGQINEIYVKRNIIARGQAFISFARPEDASRALKEMQNFNLLTKPMRIAYAKNESNAAMEPGQVPPPRPKKILKDFWNSPLFKARLSSKRSGNGKDLPASSQPEVHKENIDTSKILFLHDIPGERGEEIVEIFSKFPGYVEVRYIPARAVAFVEFRDEATAGFALSLAPKTFKEDLPLHVSFSRK